MTSPTLALDVDGPAAPPRSNGELVFAEPWQGRAFGLTMALVDRGAISYPEFRERLIGRIACWEQAHPEGKDFSYYLCWLEALEQELAEQRLVVAGDLAARSAAFAVRPAGHDHEHEHGDGLGEDRDHGHL
jgi:nitrile hydratase accessory protein